METAIPQTEQDICTACERALSLAPADYPPTLLPSKDLLGAPAWYPFEHDAWAIGESIRQALVKRRSLRQLSAFARVAEVVACVNLRRGRQSFVLALGFSEARQFAPILAAMSRDSDIDGQVVHTLLKMKGWGFRSNVEPLLNADQAWIRRLAERYIERDSSHSD